MHKRATFILSRMQATAHSVTDVLVRASYVHTNYARSYDYIQRNVRFETYFRNIQYTRECEFSFHLIRIQLKFKIVLHGQIICVVLDSKLYQMENNCTPRKKYEDNTLCMIKFFWTIFSKQDLCISF